MLPGQATSIGIDGASLRVIEPLLQQGRLPHLASIARQGVKGPLKSHHPLLSPRVWTSMSWLLTMSLVAFFSTFANQPNIAQSLAFTRTLVTGW